MRVPTSQAELKLLNRRLGVWNGTLALKRSKLTVPTLCALALVMVLFSKRDLMVLDGVNRVVWYTALSR